MQQEPILSTFFLEISLSKDTTQHEAAQDHLDIFFVVQI